MAVTYNCQWQPYGNTATGAKIHQWTCTRCGTILTVHGTYSSPPEVECDYVPPGRPFTEPPPEPTPPADPTRPRPICSACGSTVMSSWCNDGTSVMDCSNINCDACWDEHGNPQ